MKKPEDTTVYVAGASGYVGNMIVKFLRAEGYKVLTMRWDVLSRQALVYYFKNTMPDIVINCTGPKAKTIEDCEKDVVHTYESLILGPGNLASAALEVGAYFIHFSTGCVYQGGIDIAFTEKDPPNFFGNLYSRTCIRAQDTLSMLPILILRICLPVSGEEHDRNLITKFVKMPKLISVPDSITVLEDLISALPSIFEKRPIGILNAVNEGYINPQQMMDVYAATVDPQHTYQPISMEQLKETTVVERSHKVLSTAEWTRLKLLRLPPIHTRIPAIMMQYAASVASSTTHK